MAKMSSSGDIVVPLRKANANEETKIEDSDLVLLQIQAKNVEQLPNLHEEVEKSRKVTANHPNVTNVLVVVSTDGVRLFPFA